MIDARQRVVMRYDYDMLGNRIHQVSMDAGERWMLNDVTGKPIRAWDSRGHVFRTEYDALRRPVRQFVRGTDATLSDPQVFGQDILFAKTEYGEGKTNDQKLNLRTRVFIQYDSAGIVTNTWRNPGTGNDEAFDFKGNLLGGQRQLVHNYKSASDWTDPGQVELEKEVFLSGTRYDALNRPIELITPHTPAIPPSIIIPVYNEANLLNAVQANLRGEKQGGQLKRTNFVTNIDYNAKGQRTRIEYGNEVVTTYEYDDFTFRLLHLYTEQPKAKFPKDDLTPPKPPRGVQNLFYTYDPIGNITSIRDDAQDRVFHSNTCVTPSADYKYDAVYRLIGATGREHKDQGLQPNWDDNPRFVSGIPNDGKALQNYVETYRYDAVGNILQMIHCGPKVSNLNDLNQPGQVIWNKRYQYLPDNNRLLCTSQPGDPNNKPDYTTTPDYTEIYEHDVHGNIIKMPHLSLMQWDYHDQLLATSRQTVNSGLAVTTYYVYDSSGQRVRKVTARKDGTPAKERIYLGGFEIYREYNGADGATELERETLHIMDNKQRIALVETKTKDIAIPGNNLPATLMRYQFGNHLGSAVLELGDQAKIISYEEYYPFGSTSYQAVSSEVETPCRYCYTGKERDEESGLYYHGQRYYSPWLVRWLSCDKVGFLDSTNKYLAFLANPIKYLDPDGRSNVVSQLSQSEQETGMDFINMKPQAWSQLGDLVVNDFGKAYSKGKPLSDVNWGIITPKGQVITGELTYQVEALFNELFNDPKSGFTAVKNPINSGFRTMAKQEELYSKDPEFAAKPGWSPHQNALAIDIEVGGNTSKLESKLDRFFINEKGRTIRYRDTERYFSLVSVAREYGLVRTDPKEPWHWEKQNAGSTGITQLLPSNSQSTAEWKNASQVLAQNALEARLAWGLSVNDVAKSLGIKPKMIKNLESGKTKPTASSTAKLLTQLANIYQINVSLFANQR